MRARILSLSMHHFPYISMVVGTAMRMAVLVAVAVAHGGYAAGRGDPHGPADLHALECAIHQFAHAYGVSKVTA